MSTTPQNANVNIYCYKNQFGHLELPPEFVLQLLGGRWPRSQDYGYQPGFDWEQADHFTIENGDLVPYSGGHPMDGPNLRLDAIPNPLSRINADNTDL
ncbi:MAG: hypothetical protein ACXADB_14830 [Candidatus Hermodarchaeia archaeon]|jgi:hypothetical protein